VASFKAAAITSPPVTITFASTEGTKRTLMGRSGEPMAGPASSVGSAVGSSVGASVATGSSTTGASVAGAAQALSIIEMVTMSDSRTNKLRLFIFLLLS
jgi:hypothetical protein